MSIQNKLSIFLYDESHLRDAAEVFFFDVRIQCTSIFQYVLYFNPCLFFVCTSILFVP